MWPALTKYILGSAELNGKIYAVGGHRPSNYLNEVEVYEPILNQWSFAPSLHVGRTYPGVVAYEGTVWAINGTCCGGSTPHDSIEIYIPQDDAWYWSTDLGIPPIGTRSELRESAAVLDGKIHVVGGEYGRPIGLLSMVRSWDGTSWSDLQDYPHPIGNHSVTATDGKLYVTGGSGGSETLAETWIYQPATDSWLQGPNLNIPRQEHTSVAVGNKLFVIGGRSSQNGWVAMDSVEMLNLLNPETGWQLLEESSINPPGHWLSSVVFDGRIYLIGGQDRPYSPLKIVERSNIIQ